MKYCTIPFPTHSYEDARTLRDRLQTSVCKLTRGDWVTMVWDEEDGEGWYVVLHTGNLLGMVHDLREERLL